MHQSTKGFTIVEVLIAIMLLSVIILIVMSSLTGAFKISGNSSLQAVATNRAQATLEAIRGQWQTAPQYNSACVQFVLPTGTTVSVQDENADGTALGAAYAPAFAVDCSTAAPRSTISPLRRISVTSVNSSGSNTGQSQLTLEVPSP